MQDLDEFFMAEALIEARKAFDADEVPVGAVAVYQGKIIARAFNQVEFLKDASAHAELLCLKQAAKALNRWRLFDVTLYSTLEPCCMCAGALFSFRVQRLVWGAPDIRQGADGSFTSLVGLKHPIHQFEVRSLVLSEPASEIMKTFFRKKREEKCSRTCLISS